MGVRYVDFKDVEIAQVDALVVGSGFAGSVVARELAERADKRVLVIEKRAHVGGNMYDETDEAGILVHRYGPHIFHTNDKRAFDYVRRFTEWRDYESQVCWPTGTAPTCPFPFNKTSMRDRVRATRGPRSLDREAGPDVRRRTQGDHHRAARPGTTPN